MSNSELEAESHRTELLTQENASLKSQLEELHHRLSGGEEVDAPPSVKQQLKQVIKSIIVSYCVLWLPIYMLWMVRVFLSTLVHIWANGWSIVVCYRCVVDCIDCSMQIGSRRVVVSSMPHQLLL